MIFKKHSNFYFLDIFRQALVVLKKDGFFVFIKYAYKYLVHGWKYFGDGISAQEECQKRMKKNEKYIKNVLALEISDIERIEFGKYSKPEVSIIIPVFNKWQFTYKCLESLQRNTEGLEFEIIVVDNASSDETEKLFENIKNIKYIKNNENKGFAKACNQGAKESAADYLLFLNNDTVAKKRWLDPLVNELKNNKNASIVGSKLLFPNDTIQHAGIGFAKNKIPFHLFYESAFDDPKTNTRRLFSAVTGACLMIKKEDFFKIGGFDEQYKNGLEDVDLCLKIKELGKEIVYRPDSVLYHYESISDERFRYLGKNVELFLEKWRNKIKIETE